MHREGVGFKRKSNKKIKIELSQNIIINADHLQIMIEEPDKLIYRYNHAVILQKMATSALQDEKSKLLAVTNAVKDLQVAER